MTTLQIEQQNLSQKLALANARLEALETGQKSQIQAASKAELEQVKAQATSGQSNVIARVAAVETADRATQSQLDEISNRHWKNDATRKKDHWIRVTLLAVTCVVLLLLNLWLGQADPRLPHARHVDRLQANLYQPDPLLKWLAKKFRLQNQLLAELAQAQIQQEMTNSLLSRELNSHKTTVQNLSSLTADQIKALEQKSQQQRQILENQNANQRQSINVLLSKYFHLQSQVFDLEDLVNTNHSLPQ